jgi:hypothetical protein
MELILPHTVRSALFCFASIVTEVSYGAHRQVIECGRFTPTHNPTSCRSRRQKIADALQPTSQKAFGVPQQ